MPFERVEVTKLTTNGNALMGAISPDGKYVAYVTGESGKAEFVAAAGRHQQQCAVDIAPREGRYLGVAFSPDGNLSTLVMPDPIATTRDKSTGLPVLGIGAAATKDRITGRTPTTLTRSASAWPSFVSIVQNQTDSLIVATLTAVASRLSAHANGRGIRLGSAVET